MFNGKTDKGAITEAETSNSQIHAPSINLPKGGGAIRGIGEKFATNPVTGSGSMAIPIATSPGRSGFGPQLSLSYDSGSGNGPLVLAGAFLFLLSLARPTKASPGTMTRMNRMFLSSRALRIWCLFWGLTKCPRTYQAGQSRQKATALSRSALMQSSDTGREQKVFLPGSNDGPKKTIPLTFIGVPSRRTTS